MGRSSRRRPEEQKADTNERTRSSKGIRGRGSGRSRRR